MINTHPQNVYDDMFNYSLVMCGHVKKFLVCMTSLPGIVPQILQEELAITRFSLEQALNQCSSILSSMKNKYSEHEELVPVIDGAYSKLLKEYKKSILQIGYTTDNTKDFPYNFSILNKKLEHINKITQSLLNYRKRYGVIADISSYSAAALLASSALIVNVMACVAVCFMTVFQVVMMAKHMVEDVMWHDKNGVKILYYIDRLHDVSDVQDQQKLPVTFQKFHTQLQSMRENLEKAMTPMEYIQASIQSDPKDNYEKLYHRSLR